MTTTTIRVREPVNPRRLHDEIARIMTRPGKETPSPTAATFEMGTMALVNAGDELRADLITAWCEDGPLPADYGHNEAPVACIQVWMDDASRHDSGDLFAFVLARLAVGRILEAATWHWSATGDPQDWHRNIDDREALYALGDPLGGN
jgi:hypothetical protein